MQHYKPYIMKQTSTNIYKTTIVCLSALILLISPPGFSQAPGKQGEGKKGVAPLLVGSWALDFDRSMLYSDTGSAARFISKKEGVKTRIRDSFSSRSMVFHDDGGYTFWVAPGKAITGSWSLSGNGQLILVRFADGRQIQHTIMKISPSELVFTVGRTSPVTRLFNVWGLTKLNR